MMIQLLSRVKCLPTYPTPKRAIILRGHCRVLIYAISYLHLYCVELNIFTLAIAPRVGILLLVLLIRLIARSTTHMVSYWMFSELKNSRIKQLETDYYRKKQMITMLLNKIFEDVKVIHWMSMTLELRNAPRTGFEPFVP
jgi:hypothetical protein